ncbi:carbohydrate kinase family protein [Methylobacter sp. S3L5C]|uniref:carbohydrate kinase family protein n=1 Tax=Methylobacter sp. S3L5C TaxID=2839024 RepID=UPI001FACCF27|nr:PfkB family carbohydrate kinase [Methylobacter sp. S3L5C]UOA08813.1 carbohydrate kinase [Methylobacter sp. S3L5C]
MNIDVLCVGHASYDLVFSVAHHPAEDEKIFAESLVSCGGGPAANAAVTVAKLGFKAAFSGYLGQDIYGEKHYQELRQYGVNTDLIIRGTSPTPLSTVLVKADGKRALINYKGETRPLLSEAIDFYGITPKVILFDGHEPQLSTSLLKRTQSEKIPTVLDAGSVHEGTLALMEQVDYLVCSEKFARQFAGDQETALTRLAENSPTVVITLGERGLIWQRGQERGVLPAFSVNAIDTTGAGDAFHGAFAAAIVLKMNWLDALRYASAAGALCCTKIGARSGLPSKEEHRALLER